jgi:hypothetical protein
MKTSPHRIPKVSCPTSVVAGLVGPKVYPKGEADGYLVNIPELYMKGYYLCGDISGIGDSWISSNGYASGFVGKSGCHLQE